MSTVEIVFVILAVVYILWLLIWIYRRITGRNGTANGGKDDPTKPRTPRTPKPPDNGGGTHVGKLSDSEEFKKSDVF